MANFTGEYSIQTRRNVNKYCNEMELKIFGPWEYFKSWFPKFFPEDKVNKEFCKKYLLISDDINKIPAIERCINNIIYTSNKLTTGSSYYVANRDSVITSFKNKNAYEYEFISTILTLKNPEKDKENLSKIDVENMLKVELKQISDMQEKKGYLEAKDLFKLSILIYKLILMYEKNINRLPDILSAVKLIWMGNSNEKQQIRNDAELFENSFNELMVFYKKELYPIILKNMDLCFEQEINEDQERRNLVYELLDITPEDIFTYEDFTKEYERTKRIIEQSSQMESEENDSVKESINFLNRIFQDSNINNIFDFEFVLPYFLKNIISNDDLKLEAAELASISKEDPTQIVISIFSVIWYSFLTSFEIENEQENSDIISELCVLKTRWQKYFGVFKKYFEKLLNHNKEADNSRKIILKDMLNEVKSQIFYINNMKNPESLSEFLKDVILFFNKLEANKIKFFIRAKLKNERIRQEDSINVLRNYKKLIESFGYLLADRNSFLIRNVNEIKLPTDYEKAILVKFYLI